MLFLFYVFKTANDNERFFSFFQTIQCFTVFAFDRIVIYFVKWLLDRQHPFEVEIVRQVVVQAA